jgi:hypothetical protein
MTGNIDLVRALGADQVIDDTRNDFADGGHRYDLILDIGGNSSLSRLRRALTNRGRLTIVGGETGGRWLGGFDRSLRAPIMSAFEIIKKAGSLDQDKLIKAASGVTVLTPFGMVEYRPIDHQSTMGAYVGQLAKRDGKGTMVNWRYADGANYLPSDQEIKALRKD